jgi:tetratricopeptide (TPR) repeat protein
LHKFILTDYLLLSANGDRWNETRGIPGKRGEIGTSMRQSGRSMENISQNARYFFHRADEAAHKGDYLQALEYCDHALSTDPHYAEAWHEKGTCLDELGWWEEALASYDEALIHDPCNPETWFKKGLILKRSGREDEAFSCFNRGIDPTLGKRSRIQGLFSIGSILISQFCLFIRMIHLRIIRVIHRGSRVSRDVLSMSLET